MGPRDHIRDDSGALETLKASRRLVGELDQLIGSLARSPMRDLLSRLAGALDDSLSLYEDECTPSSTACVRAPRVRQRLQKALQELVGAKVLEADGKSYVSFPGSRFSVAEVLQFLAFNEKSGVATIAAGDETIDLELSNGRLIDARSDRNPKGLRIGEILVAQGAIDPEVLIEFLTRQDEKGARTGDGLAKENLITREQLAEALRYQVRHYLRRCLEAKKADVIFVPDKVHDQTDLMLDITGMLLEGAAIADRPEKEPKRLD